MKEKKDINQYITDTIMERPYGFSVDFTCKEKKGKTRRKECHFYLYPITLGKIFLLQRLIEALDINQKNLELDSSVEALRLASHKKEICLTIITYCTCKSKEEVFDSMFVNRRKDFLSKHLSDEDIAVLILMAITHDKTRLFISNLGIDKEQDRLSAIMKVKNKGSNNNISIGGVSQFGTLLDAACERYGWTKEYVVWGIDYSSLRLMLADKVTSLYLSDEELKRVPKWALTSNSTKIKADDPNNKELIKSMSWK